MRQLIYTMFITNNRASFLLWWVENLAKHQKISKYCGNGCQASTNCAPKGYEHTATPQLEHGMTKVYHNKVQVVLYIQLVTIKFVWMDQISAYILLFPRLYETDMNYSSDQSHCETVLCLYWTIVKLLF